jgi:hypothetical protein
VRLQFRNERLVERHVAEVQRFQGGPSQDLLLLDEPSSNRLPQWIQEAYR